LDDSPSVLPSIEESPGASSHVYENGYKEKRAKKYNTFGMTSKDAADLSPNDFDNYYFKQRPEMQNKVVQELDLHSLYFKDSFLVDMTQCRDINELFRVSRQCPHRFKSICEF